MSWDLSTRFNNWLRRAKIRSGETEFRANLGQLTVEDLKAAFLAGHAAGVQDVRKRVKAASDWRGD
jgi:hypothetical protein